jgi:hypothetical protein
MRNNLDRIGVDAAQHGADLPQQLEQPQLNFIVPTEHVPLPSKGRFYPRSHPLHNLETVEVKQMTAKEEDILTSRNLLKKGVALDKLLQSIVINKGINTDSLTAEDRSAIIIAARISAYGADYATTVTCPACTAKTKYTFNLLEKLDSAEQIQPVEVDEKGLFSITLPVTKWVVKCRALNGYDEKAIIRLSEAKKNPSEGDSLMLEQLKMTVISINGIEDRVAIESALSGMPARDSKHLRNTYQEIVKGIDMRHTFSCSSCEYEGELEVPLTPDFFWFK